MSAMAPSETGPARLRRGVSVAAVVGAALAGHLWYGNRHNFFDLRIYWSAIRWWRDGHELYAYAFKDPIQGDLGFTYPPFAAIVLWPLGLLRFPAASAVVFAACACALTVSVYLLVDPLAQRYGVPRWYALGLALPLATWLEPVRETITFGQINLLLVTLILVDLLVVVPRGWRLAGAGIGLAAAIKLTPAIFILYLLLTRRGRAAATAMATTLGATLLAAALAWHESSQFWTDKVFQTSRIGHLERLPNQSLLGTLARLDPTHEPAQWLWAVLAVLVLGFGMWRARRAGLAGDELTGLTLTALTGSLISPVTWSHHLFWFAPAVALLLRAGLGKPRRWGRLALAVLVYVTVTAAVIDWYDWGLDRATFGRGVVGFLIGNWFVLLMVALLGLLPVRVAEPAPEPTERSEPTAEPEPVTAPRSPVA